jgi:hypothetical protein
MLDVKNNRYSVKKDSEKGSGFRIQGTGYRMQETGIRIRDSGFAVQGASLYSS